MKIKYFEVVGDADLPWMAKTQYSLSTGPALFGRPKSFDVPIREVKPSVGAGFVVAVCGNIMTMPGVPEVPSAGIIDINDKGEIVGLLECRQNPIAGSLPAWARCCNCASVRFTHGVISRIRW
jgi:formyltetrahydrofolate synthetase